MSTKKCESGVTKSLHRRTATRFHKFMKMAAMPLLFLFLTAAVRGQSALDGFDPNANGTVNVVVVQPDGKILIGGTFNTVLGVARNRIARLNPDGTLDTAFDPNANSTVFSIAVQADGKILAGGAFGGIGGQTRPRIARLDATTGLADSFNPSANNVVNSIAVQADGKILAGGNFDGIGGQARNYIARLDATTGLAESFDPNPSGNVTSIAVQADGKILAGGNFFLIGGQTRHYIARLDATGLADSFDPNANNTVSSIAVQADGKILAGGAFIDIGEHQRNGIARLDATTGAADSFNPNANNPVESIAVQADGKILVGGIFTSIGGQTRNRIARLDATVGVADSFDPNASGSPFGTIYSIAVQADGKVLAGGDFTTLAPNGGAPVTRNHIARLETDSRLDQTLNFTTVDTSVVYATAVQPDGKILIGGSFVTAVGEARKYIARLNTDGTLDTAFNPNADVVVFSIAIQPDGKILAGGAFTVIGGQARNCIARLDAVTGLADSFNPNATGGLVSTIVVQADGKILAGGGFTSIGGQTRNRIARLDSTTGQADSFDPNANDYVSTIAVQADGKILAGGGFNGANSIGGQTRNRIARLDATTGLADSFNANANDEVSTIAVQADGKILAGGLFTSIGGQPRSRIGRLDAVTGHADLFNPIAGGLVNTVVYSIAVQADGKILACGGFTSIGGQPRNFIARLDSTTGLADSFNPNADNYVDSIAVQADGKILAGGQFSNIGGQTRTQFARLTNDTVALQNLAATRATVNWASGGSRPQFTRVTFEYSTDHVNYTPLGNGTAAGSNWTLTGLNLSIGQNIYIRARGYYRSGSSNRSDSITESVRNAFFVPPTITSANNTTFTVGAAGTFSVTTTGIPTGASMSITESGALPAGVIFVNNNNGTATLAGTPNAGTTGSYPIIITASNGVSPNASQNFTLTVNQPPAITSANNITFTTNVPGTFSITTTGFPTDASMAITESGALPAGVTFTNNNNGTATLAGTPGAGTAGTYPLIITANNGITPNATQNFTLTVIAPPPTPTPTPRPATLGNISTRLQVGTADRVMIAGFIVQGSSPKRVLIRAAGPSLAQFGVPNPLANPRLELHDTNNTIGINDDWQTTQIGGVITSDQVAEIQNSGLAPSDPLESAVIATLAPGSYTAIVQGVNNGTGVGIVEAYDLNATSGSLLANISTRGFVQTGDNAMIGGFIVVTQATRVIIRAIGPSLTPFGVPDALVNPQLELHDATSLIGRNDDWQTTQIFGIITSDQVAAIQNSQLAPTNSAESAIIATLQPGSYTAIVRGFNSTTGNALVEVYALQ